jgi:hypothetical protein
LGQGRKGRSLESCAGFSRLRSRRRRGFGEANFGRNRRGPECRPVFRSATESPSWLRFIVAGQRQQARHAFKRPGAIESFR